MSTAKKPTTKTVTTKTEPAKKAAAKKVAAPAKTASKKSAPAKASTSTGAVARAPHGTGVGAFVREQLLKGKDTTTILEGVGKKFPEAHTNAASVSWYRTQLRNAGELA